ncbi:ABC transporter permease [Angustibacter aerolatus]
MLSYVVRRVVAMLLMLVALSMVVFGLFQVLPADPAALTCGKSCTPVVIAANRRRLGYDRPVTEQYARFVSAIFVGRDYGVGRARFHCDAPCLGHSFARGVDVRPLLVERMGVTAQEAVGGFVLWIAVGVGGGVLAALWHRRWPDRTLMSLSLLGYSFPDFFIGLLLLYFVVFRFHVMSYPAYTPFHEDPAAWLRSMLLPWVTLAVSSAAFYTRLTRTQVLDTMGEDFVRTARSKGLGQGAVIGRHVLRAGLTPVVTAAGIDLAGLLGGVVIAEQVFGLPGLGRLALDSVVTYDLPLIVGTVLLAAAFVIVANLVVDLLYAVLDPRVRLT